MTNWEGRMKNGGAAVPIIIVATLEAVLGLLQYWLGADPRHRMAQGTYPNHSHYADLLAMALPFAIMYAVVFARREKSSEAPARSMFFGTLLLAAAPIIFLAVIFSLSGGGIISCLASLALLGILRSSRSVRSGWRWAAAAGVALLTILAFFLIPPDPVFERFAGELELGEGSRPALWSEALKVFPAYPVFGCGLGAYESALYRTSNIMHDRLIDYAHNDYLQLLVELGVVGFIIGAALVVAVLRPALRLALANPMSERGALAVACVAALAAFLIHCFYNFNFYAPANAIMVANISVLISTNDE